MPDLTRSGTPLIYPTNPYATQDLEMAKFSVVAGVASVNTNNVGQVQTTANVPVIGTAATALAANTSRKGWMIQNVGQNPLFVLLATGASTSVFHVVLKGGTGDSDGLGGSFSNLEGVVYTGIVTVAGTSPKYVVLEL